MLCFALIVTGRLDLPLLMDRIASGATAAPGRKRKSGFSNFNGFYVRSTPESGPSGNIAVKGRYRPKPDIPHPLYTRQHSLLPPLSGLPPGA
jgi:hypothetical protein